jgi:hypothetical protein
MPSHSFNLFGKDTFELISVSHGTRYRERWTLEQHPGPKVMRQLPGGSGRTALYLYPQHLKLLYARFKQANPTGACVEMDGMHETKYTPIGLTELQVEALHEARRIFVDLTHTDEELGYPHLRRYLPEIFEPDVEAAMRADPWLDSQLLGRAVSQGHVPGHFEDQLEQHPRWLPDWKEYCVRHFAMPGNLSRYD